MPDYQNKLHSTTLGDALDIEELFGSKVVEAKG